VSGSAPSTRDRLLMSARAELAPDKSLAAVNESSARVVGAVSVAATLVSALGLLSATELADVGWAWALPSILLSALAAALAVWATVPVFDEVAPGNLEDVDRYFTHQLRWRGGTVRAAALSFGLGLALTPLPALVAAVDAPDPSWDVTVARQGAMLSFSVTGEHLGSDSVVELALVKPKPGRLLEAEADSHGKASGKASLPLTAVGGATRLQVKLKRPRRRDEARFLPLPAPEAQP
jgi:hypothetical protein